MSTYIHTRKTAEGFVYRVWSTVTDSYYTPEMSKVQLVQWLVEYDLERTLQALGMDLLRRFERAETTGSSCHHESRDPTAWVVVRDWDDPALLAEPAEDYLGATEERVLSAEPHRPAPMPLLIDGRVVVVETTVRLVAPELLGLVGA